MKNFAKIIVVAALASMLLSCKDSRHSSATFSLGVTFEMNEGDIAAYMKDSLMYAPYLSWDQIAIFKSNTMEVNTGYLGGFVLSAKTGGHEDTDYQSIFASADPGAGAGGSQFYLSFLQTGSMPQYDVELDFSNYDSAVSSVVGCYICNSLSNKRVADRGEIEDGDYLKVVAEFYLGSLSVGRLEKYLIDYVTTRELNVVNEWEVWNMADQAKSGGLTVPAFDHIKFSVETSRSIFTPSFCMDNFVVELSVEY